MRPLKHNFTVIDTELTGLRIEENGDRIVSLGGSRMANNPKQDITREWFFNPGKDSTPDALAVHGLTTEFLSQQRTFLQQKSDVALFLTNAKIVVHCHYRPSDDKSVDELALNAEFNRVGHPDISHDRFVNLKKIARQISPNANSLNDMLDHYGINRKSRDIFHGALDDTKLTAKLFRAYLNDTTPALKKILKKMDLT
ncbi:MAG: polymerase epsilon subunit [Micavibrio sp.]|nr:polymerase epsilon subunit [Micavibrio sp.]